MNNIMVKIKNLNWEKYNRLWQSFLIITQMAPIFIALINRTYFGRPANAVAVFLFEKTFK